MSKYIIRQAAVYLIGDVLAKIIPFLVIPYLTNILGPEEFGLLSYNLAVIFALATFFNFGQDIVYTKSKFSESQLKAETNFVFGFLFSLFLFILSILVAELINLYNGTDIYILLVCCSFSLFMLNKSYAYCQTNIKISSYISMQIGSGILSAILTILVFEFGFATVESRIGCLLISNLFFSLYFASRLKFDFCLVKAEIIYIYKKFFVRALPTLWHSIALVVKNTLDKIIIANTFSMNALGVFSLSFQICSVYNLFLSSVNKSLMPHYFAFLSKNNWGNKNVVITSTLTILVSPLAYFFATLVPDYFYLSIFGSEFSGLKEMCAILLASFSLNIPYFLLGNFLIHRDRNKSLAICTTVCSLIYLVVLFIIEKEIVLAAWAFFISNVIQVIYLIILIVSGNEEEN